MVEIRNESLPCDLPPVVRGVLAASNPEVDDIGHLHGPGGMSPPPTELPPLERGRSSSNPAEALLPLRETALDPRARARVEHDRAAHAANDRARSEAEVPHMGSPVRAARDTAEALAAEETAKARRADAARARAEAKPDDESSGAKAGDRDKPTQHVRVEAPSTGTRSKDDPLKVESKKPRDE